MSQADDRDALLALDLRLMEGDEGRAHSSLRIFPGRIPDDLPVQIPVPPGARIIGSRVQEFGRIIIILESDLPPSEVAGWYQEQLAAAGWQSQSWDREGGFVEIRPEPNDRGYSLASDSRIASLAVWGGIAGRLQRRPYGTG